MFVLEEVSLYDLDGGEDFGVLIAPVVVEFFETHSWLAEEENYKPLTAFPKFGHVERSIGWYDEGDTI